MLTLQHLWLLVRRSVSEFSDDNCTQLAAAISYYVLFSLFPLAIVATVVAGFVLRDSELQQDLINNILENFPLTQDQDREEVTDIVTGVTGTTASIGLIGLVTMLWSGSAVFGTVRRSLNIAYDLHGSRPFLRQKLLDFGLMLLVSLFFLSSIVLTALLQAARAASDDVPVFGAWADTLGPAWLLLSFLLPIVLSFVAFAVLYWFVPATHVPWRSVWPGALFASIGFEVLKVGFSIYVANFGNYDVVFGSLAAVVIFLFWVFIAANIMLFGAELASEYPRVMRGDYDVPDDPNAVPVPLRIKVWRVVKGLVVHTPEPESSPEASPNPKSEPRPDSRPEDAPRR